MARPCHIAVGRPNLPTVSYAAPVGCRRVGGGGGETATMRAWRVHAYGEPLEVLQLDEVEVPEPGPGEVRVAVQAIPLNLNDLERINGGNMMVRPELPYSPGMEVMGVVEACGPGAERWMDERVVATTKTAIGGFAERAICTATAVFPMPGDIELPGAAALYFPFHLAWLGLFDRAGLQAGETVLVHAAAGGAGSAAVQLAKDAGATVFATAGSDEKVALCRELGADVAVNYTEADFREVVLSETANRGVDVVFDNVGQAVFDPSLDCTAYNGRYLMMGFASNKVGGRRALRGAPPDRPGQPQALRRDAQLPVRRDDRRGEVGDGLERGAVPASASGSPPRSSTGSARARCGPWSARWCPSRSCPRPSTPWRPVGPPAAPSSPPGSERPPAGAAGDRTSVERVTGIEPA